jgi:uncharacterized protein (TIGR02118 family)
MVKFVLLIKRKPGLSRAEFSRHWREVHGPLVMSLPEVSRHFASYVQNHLIDGSNHPQAAAAAEFDGIAEIVYLSAESRDAMVREPEYHELVVPDEERFIDRGSVVAYQVEEYRMKREDV